MTTTSSASLAAAAPAATVAMSIASWRRGHGLFPRGSGRRPVRAERYSPRLETYCTTPSGIRYQQRPALLGAPAAVGRGDRQRRHLDQLQHLVGHLTKTPVMCSRRSSYPGRLTPTKRASSNSPSQPCHDRIEASASAPVMKYSSRVGVEGVRVAQRVPGVGGAGAVDVDAAHREAGIGRGGDHRHQIAVLGRRNRPGPSATADRWARTRPRRGRTGRRPHSRRPGGRNGWGRTSHPSPPACACARLASLLERGFGTGGDHMRHTSLRRGRHAPCPPSSDNRPTATGLSLRGGHTDDPSAAATGVADVTNARRQTGSSWSITAASCLADRHSCMVMTSW